MTQPKTNPVIYILLQAEGKPESERVDISDLITSFSYEDSEKKADLVKITVDNWDLGFFDNPIWTPGNRLLVTWGYPGVMAPVRSCIIQKIKGGRTLSIEAQSDAVLMNKVKKTRTFDNVTRAEVIKRIAGEYGYGGSRVDVQATLTRYEHICQTAETDGQFVKRLAESEHFEFFVDFDGFHCHERRMGQRPARVLSYYLPPDVGDIIDFDVDNDIFAKAGQVTTKGRDTIAKKDVGGEASDSKTEREALNPVTEIIDPATGLSTFQLAASSADLKPTTATTNAQAKREADGAFKRSVQTTVKLSLDLVGDPGIAAKSVVEVRNISKRLSGLYYVNEITHTIDSGGYKMKMKCSTDGTNKAPGAGAKSESKATVNEKRGNPDDGALELTENVDDATGLSTYQYGEKGGRQKT